MVEGGGGRGIVAQLHAFSLKEDENWWPPWCGGMEREVGKDEHRVK